MAAPGGPVLRSVVRAQVEVSCALAWARRWPRRTGMPGLGAAAAGVSTGTPAVRPFGALDAIACPAARS